VVLAMQHQEQQIATTTQTALIQFFLPLHQLAAARVEIIKPQQVEMADRVAVVVTLQRLGLLRLLDKETTAALEHSFMAAVAVAQVQSVRVLADKTQAQAAQV
jgi:hypothetical protein